MTMILISNQYIYLSEQIPIHSKVLLSKENSSVLNMKTTVIETPDKKKQHLQHKVVKGKKEIRKMNKLS